ncbi:MAG: HNH endonuclease [Candidatus Roizmanbacteria bacterium]|nr:HNH endonuclease [Candidatus Roizmanbacteria bacterium]
MNCYRCDKPLNEQNESEEHLIPNSIGGHTISKKLLCRNCNSILASLDASLAKQLNIFMVLLNPKRDNGNIPHINAKNIHTKEDVYLNANGTEFSKYPEYINNEDGSITVKASKLKRLNQELKKIKKENPSAKIEEPNFSKQSKYGEYHSFSEVNLDLIHNGFLKIAINHFIEFEGEFEFIKNAVKNLIEDEPYKKVFIYPLKDWINVNLDELKFHYVNINGCYKNNMLYANIALFNYYRATVLLDKNYTGRDFTICKIHPVFGRIQDSDKKCELDIRELNEIFDLS